MTDDGIVISLSNEDLQRVVFALRQAQITFADNAPMHDYARLERQFDDALKSRQTCGVGWPE